MILRIAAMAAFAVASCLAVPARAQQSPPAVLTLDEAFARVARAHPALRLFGANTDVLLAERDEAALRPPLRLGVVPGATPGKWIRHWRQQRPH